MLASKECMHEENIDMMVQLLEKNSIPVLGGTRKEEGSSSSENKDRCHALVVVSSVSSSFIIY